ncbi:MAG: 3-deoxy-D-manno-octulosonic acid transferase [Alphaproteobacteria bacterium]|nr:3-deoxy-D-manno-octulosonic acid transferase [Alphaproteobacteria bacterium]
MLIKVYRILLSLFSPLLRLYFYARCLYGKDKIESVQNHFGKATIARPEGKLIWIHAASIGESMAALTFIKHIKKQFPNLNILLTTITVTSEELIKPAIAVIPNCYHQFAVTDNYLWIKRFLDYWKPAVVVFVESEIWPNTIDLLHDRSVPTFLLNARLSPKSFNRWLAIKQSSIQLFQKFSCIMAQSEVDYKRFASFSPQNTKRIDNLKYANAVLPCNNALLDSFKKICENKTVFVVASTHEKEEEIILDAHKKLKEKFNIVTIIIPRHLTRVKAICETIKKHNLDFALRSSIPTNLEDVTPKFSEYEIFCVDSFGEVGTFYRLADICFVGGSLVPIGGHNIYEPVALGKPVLHGIHMENALEVRNYLHIKRLAFEVKNSDDICRLFEELLSEGSLEEIRNQALSITKNEALKQIDEIMNLAKIIN